MILYPGQRFANQPEPLPASLSANLQFWVRSLALFCSFGFCCSGLPLNTIAQDTVAANSRNLIVVVGAAGEDVYRQGFAEWAEHWNSAGLDAGFHVQVIGIPSVSTAEQAVVDSANSAADSDAVGDQPVTHDLHRFETCIKQMLVTSTAAAGNRDATSQELWIVFIGHGTFDGKKAKFNLVGPDLEPEVLAEWLRPWSGKTVIINCSSASSPFVNLLSGPGRIVITATRNANEQNYARFGGFLATALKDENTDLDRDGQVSLWELFVAAADRTQTFYEEQSRLATEHPLLDDNGDARGTPAEFFRPDNRSRPTGGEPDGAIARRTFLKQSAAELSLSAEQRQQRDRLELELEKLKSQKATFAEDTYYSLLEKLLVQLAEIYQSPETDRQAPP